MEFTVLHEAVAKGLVRVVKLLLDAGADVYAENVYGRTALDMAIANEHKEIEKMLRAAEARIKPDLKVLLEGDLSDKEKTFLQEEWPNIQGGINVKDACGFTVLHRAVRKGFVGVVKALLKDLKGIDPNVMDKDGNTPLHNVKWAAFYSNKEIVDALLRLTSKIQVRTNKNGKTPRDLVGQAHPTHMENGYIRRRLIEAASIF